MGNYKADDVNKKQLLLYINNKITQTTERDCRCYTIVSLIFILKGGSRHDRNLRIRITESSSSYWRV